MAKKITQNVNKDAGLMDLPKVRVPRSKWKTEHSNYITSNIGDIVPIYVDEVVPNEKRKVTMGMLSHMTTPVAPIFNAQYTEFRSFFVPYRMCADLLNGYSTRKSPFVKVFGEDNASSNANIIVPLTSQKLPTLSVNIGNDFRSNLSAFGGVADALDYDFDSISGTGANGKFFQKFNLLDFAAYELIYQYKYRNQNREAATNSSLYKWLFNIYARTSASPSYSGCDAFHKANREKDYFTGSAPFTQKSSSPISVGLSGELPVYASIKTISGTHTGADIDIADVTTHLDSDRTGTSPAAVGDKLGINFSNSDRGLTTNNLAVNLESATGVDINSLRLMIKTQELLEKDSMYGSDYASSLNARFGCCPMSLIIEEPLELKKVTITSHMQPIFQTSTTTGEATILGTIGANVTTQSGEFEILPETHFKEYGLIVICAVHKAQNSYDSKFCKPKRIFKQGRFDFYTPELNDLGYQPVSFAEFNAYAAPNNAYDSAVGYNEAWAEYRYKFNKVHGMFEPSRTGALNYWTLANSGYTDIQSLYKQNVTELDRAISVDSTTAPQFFDAFGFVEINDKPMSLHSIPGMDGVI